MRLKFSVLVGLAVVLIGIAGSTSAISSVDGTEIIEEDVKEFENCSVWGTLYGKVVRPIVNLQCFESTEPDLPLASCFMVRVARNEDGTTKIELDFMLEHTLHDEDTVNVQYRFDDSPDTVENLTYFSRFRPIMITEDSEFSTPGGLGKATKSLNAEELIEFLKTFANAEQFEFSLEDQSDITVSMPLGESDKAVQEFRERVKEVLNEASKDSSEQDDETNTNK